MKVIIKPKIQIQEFEAIHVDDLQKGQVLTDTEDCKQVISIKEGIKYLVEDSKDNTDKYTSNTHIEIKIEDYIIKTDRGYTVCVYPLIEVTEDVEKAIEILR